MDIKESIQLSGTLEVAVIRASDGLLVDWWKDENLIVNGAREMLARLIAGDGTGDSVTDIGFGTGSEPASPNDQGLTAAHWRPLSGHAYPASGKVRFSFVLSTTEANGITIREFGLRTSSGELFSRKVRGGIEKNSDISLEGTWTITF